MTRFIVLVSLLVGLLVSPCTATSTSAPVCRPLPPSGPDLSRGDASEPGRVALTFDDGPDLTATPRVLDLLAEHDVHATFFLVGAAITRRSHELVKRMVDEGHSLGAHSYGHDIDMASRYDDGGDYIEGQYVLGHVAMELALLAEDGDDFDRIFDRVFQREQWNRLSTREVRTQWRAIEARHLALLEERVRSGPRRPYPLLLTRPPGGLPYITNGLIDRQAAARHESVMRRRGWLSVLWHGGSGDTVPGKKDDLGFLRGNLRVGAKQGGILLIHDRMKLAALGGFLSAMRERPDREVVPLERFVESKFLCTAADLRWTLNNGRPQAPEATWAEMNLARVDELD